MHTRRFSPRRAQATSAGPGVAPRPRVQAGHPLYAPSAASSVAIASLADGVVPRAHAVRSIRGDLLDTYEALLRSSLADTGDALRAGFPEKAAGSAATARGYWWILRDTFIGQRGAPAATQLDRAFERLVGAARTGEPAATAAATATIGDDLLAFRAAPLSASEQARRAGQLIRFLALVPVEYGRGSRERQRRRADFEIQEAIAFRDGAADRLRRPPVVRSPRATSRRTRSVRLALDGPRRPPRRRGARHRGGRARRGRGARDDRDLDALGDVYPADWKAGTDEADFDLIAHARCRRSPRSPSPATCGAPSRGAPGGVRVLRVRPGAAPARPRAVSRSSGSKASSGSAPTAMTASRSSCARTRPRTRSPGRWPRSISRSGSPPRRSAAVRSPAPPSSPTARSSSSAKGSRRC